MAKNHLEGKYEFSVDYFNDFPLTFVGAESIHVFEICDKLSRMNVQVRLFSPTANMPKKLNFMHTHVWTPHFLISVFYELFIIPRILIAWSFKKPDAVYVRVTPILISPIILAKIYQIPIYAEINGTIHEELGKSGTFLSKILLLFKISDIVEKITYKNATKVITVTDSLKTYVSRSFGIEESKIIVVPNGVDADLLTPMPKKNNSKEITIGYVGGLMWWQGLDYIIDGFKIALSKQQNLKLVIYGDGPEKNALIKKAMHSGARDRISFPGRISHDKVSNAINTFDICIAYYVKARDGLNSPFKIYEYLSCGKPVIVSDIKGTGDVFKSVTLVVQAENPKLLADSIISLAENSDQRNRLGMSGRAYILDGHTWFDSAKKIKFIMEPMVL